MTDELTCQELVELVTDYLEGTLAPDERRRFDAHLAGCRGCAAYLQQFRRTIELTGRLTEDDIGGPAGESLLSRFREWKTQRGGG